MVDNSGFYHKAKHVTTHDSTFIQAGGDSYITYNTQYVSGNTNQSLPLRPLKHLSPFFTGRESYLNQLKEYFTSEPTSRKSFLLYGVGGIGKTQICLKFLEEADGRFEDVFWIDASTEQSIIHSLQQIASVKGLLQSAQATMAESALCWISNLKTTWLFVFDNAGGDHKLLENYFPPGNGGNILINSRDKGLERMTAYRSLAVAELNEGEAVGMLLRCSNLGSCSKSAAKKVVTKLGYVPFLIDQVGAYMHTHQCDTRRFLGLFKGVGDISTVEKLHLGLIEGRRTKLGEGHPDTLRAMHNLANIYRERAIWSEAERWGLEVVEKRTKNLGSHHPDTLASMEILALVYMGLGRYGDAEKMGLHVAAERKKWLGKDHPDALRVTNDLGLFCRKQGKWNEAELWGLQAVEGKAKRLGLHHPDTLASMESLIITYWQQGKWMEAEKLFKQLFEGRKASLGDDHPRTLAALHYLEVLCRAQRKWNEAGEWGKQAVERRKKILGERHPDTRESMKNLALTYHGQGQLKKAAELFAQMTTKRRVISKKKRPEARIESECIIS